MRTGTIDRQLSVNRVPILLSLIGAVFAMTDCVDGIKIIRQSRTATVLDRETGSMLFSTEIAPDTNARILHLIRSRASSSRVSIEEEARDQGMSCRHGDVWSRCFYTNSIDYKTCPRPLDAFYVCSNGNHFKQGVTVKLYISADLERYISTKLQRLSCNVGSSCGDV